MNTVTGIRSTPCTRITPRPSRPGICTSRKTRSGFSVTRARTASRPSRHSPTTTMSACGAKSCRMPRRASGSSSTINARISPTGGLQETEGDTHRRPGSATRRTLEHEGCARAVQGGEPLPRIREAHALRAGALGRPRPIISHGQHQLVFFSPRLDPQQRGLDPPRQAVPDGVLHQRLENEVRDGGAAEVVGYPDLGAQAIREADLLDGEVLTHELQL